MNYYYNKNNKNKKGEIAGYWSAFVKRDGSEEWITIFENVHNVYTNAGRDRAHQEQYTNTAAGTRGAGFVAVSADTAAPAATDTALTGEITTGGLARADATTKTHTNGTNTSTIEHTYTASAAHTAVHKAAIFNAASAGTMSHAAVFSTDVTLAINDQLKVTFTLTLG